jgi:hypothetical protein
MLSFSITITMQLRRHKMQYIEDHNTTCLSRLMEGDEAMKGIPTHPVFDPTLRSGVDRDRTVQTLPFRPISFTPPIT